MKKKYQNGFFIFGLVVLGIMLTQLDYSEVWSGIQRAGYWFLAVVVLWAALYMLNTAAWYIIIRQGRHNAGGSGLTDKTRKVGYWWLYKITISGFALNYATPGGLMGGEAYRIMELTPRLGAERATSSVILYVMTHIFSHFWFWLLSAIIFMVTQPLTFASAMVAVLALGFSVLGIWFFMKGYKKGLAMRLAKWLSRIPGINRWAKNIVENHQEKLRNIDLQIAALHKQNPRTFIGAVALELACRFISCFEIMFCLLVLTPDVSYIQCVIMLAFTSLFANLLFFIPLQLGGREGGFMMSAAGLAMTASSGIFTALIIRIRELIWTAAGLMLIKIQPNHKK